MGRRYQSSEAFFDAIDRDWAWRKHELSLSKKSIDQAPEKRVNTEIRKGVLLLYAHWEGFIKHASVEFLQYVVERKYKKRELTDNYRVLMFRKQIQECSNSKKIRAHISAVSSLLKSPDEVVLFNPKLQINTDSNLNYERFSGILDTLNIDDTDYKLHEKEINETLLKNRNSIAHGEYLSVDRKSFIELFSNIMKLLETFKTDVQNLCIAERFKV